MKLDRYTARALVDANLMSLSEYIEQFGSPDEKEAGSTDCLHVVRIRPAGPQSRVPEEEPSYRFPFAASQRAVIRFHCN